MLKLKPILNKILNENIGYRAGKFEPLSPAETLKDRGFGLAKSKTGLLGTGYYFMGDLDKAKKLKSDLNYGVLSKIDLSKYNLYSPSDPENFYENIKAITYYLNGLKKEDLKSNETQEYIEDAIDVFSEYLSLNKQETKKIFYNYIDDILNKKDGDLLSNRLLYKYDGINFIGTSYDDFGAGSLIFNKKLKPGTYNEIN